MVALNIGILIGFLFYSKQIGLKDGSLRIAELSKSFNVVPENFFSIPKTGFEAYPDENEVLSEAEQDEILWNLENNIDIEDNI